MSLLVTGFGPFEDVAVNASGAIAEALSGAEVGRERVAAEVLPTAFGAARERLAALVREHAPRAVVALGVSRDAWPRLERRADGVVRSERADVAGEVWLGRALGASERTVGAGYAAWLEAARAVDPAVRPSDDCGGYVCNAVFHALLEALPEDVPGVFLHVPRELAPEVVEARAALVRALLAAMLVSS